MSMLLSFPIWEKLGGREHAVKLIEAELGKELKRETIYRWIWQRRLPSKAGIICLNEAIQRGIPATIQDCEIRGVPRLKACASPGRPKKKEQTEDVNVTEGSRGDQ